MKKLVCLIALGMTICSVFAQKSKYEYRDLVFQVFEQIDNEKSNLEVIASLKRKFTVVEEDSCVLVKGLPAGFDTRIYFLKTKVVFEQKNVETTADLDMINSAITSVVDMLNRFGYIITANYEYKNYSLKRNNNWSLYTDLNPYQGIAWLIIKGNLKIQKTEEQKQLEEKEKKTRKEKERKERQELLKREKEIERILPVIEQTNISYAVNDFYNKKYFEKIKSDDSALTLQKLEFNGDVDVLIRADTTGVDIVKIGEEIVDADSLILSQASTKYCTFNGVDYYKYQGYIFCHKKIYVRTKIFEKGYGGLRNKGGVFEYYKNVSDSVKKACEQSFTKRGEYFFEYTIVGDDVSVKELNSLERKQKDEIRGGKTIGRKILNIGGIVVLIGVLAACSSL